MKDLETIRKINGTSKAEAARAARPWTYANGLDKPPVQLAPKKSRKAPKSLTVRKRLAWALYLGTLAGALVASAFSRLGYSILAGASLLILTRKEFNE